MRRQWLRDLGVSRFTPLVVILLLLAACGTAATATPPPAAAPTSTPTTAPSGAGTGTVPTATAAPATAPAQVVPTGKVTLAWHAGISSAWLDPQENPAMATPYNFAYAMHDAMVKGMPEDIFTPSLAERYEIAEDFQSATFFLRPGVKFHNGETITSEDVKFTFENYRGAQADFLHELTDQVEAVDERTVRFHFNKPFLDFLGIYGSFATGSGWIVPAAYYQRVGQDEFKVRPVGAGPYKLVRQEPGVRLEFEAFSEYHRPVHTKELVMVNVPEASTRLAQLQGDEADIMYLVAGELIETVQNDPELTLVPTKTTGAWALEFPGFENPSSPFHDIRVREAISLALNRQALSDAETGGFSIPIGGWIPEGIFGAVEDIPAPEQDLVRAKELMAAAGYPDGFEVEWLTPLPPFFSFGERVIGQLHGIGIRPRLQTMERGAFFDKLNGGVEAWPGVQIVQNVTGTPGDWRNRYDAYFKCGGFASRTCVPELDELFEQYEQSLDPAERAALSEQIQREIAANHYFVPIYLTAFVNAIGPRIASEPGKDIFGVPQMWFYATPWENVRLKE